MLNEDETPGIDIQVQLTPITIDYQYNIVTPSATDPEKITFEYKSDKIDNITTTSIDGGVTHINFSYNTKEEIESFEVLNSLEERITFYEVIYNGTSITVNKDGLDFLTILTHNTGQVYSIINDITQKTKYFTYEGGDLSTIQVFDNSLDISNGTPELINTFTYSPYGSSIFTAVIPIHNIFILNEIEEFKLTKYFSTSNNKVNLQERESVNNALVDYRTIFNEDEYPISISMIFRVDDKPVKQIIHNITYLD